MRLISAIFFFIIFPGVVHADVIVHDAIALRGEEIMLEVETKGKFLPKGGEVVEFYLDGKSIGKSLSGGDGSAFKQFKPLRTGMYRIMVRSGREEGKGLLLSLKKGAGILFVDVEGSLIERGFSVSPKKGSQGALKKLSGRVPVVFLQTGPFGIEAAKKWLHENGFIDSPVIPWRQGLVFNEIREKGLMIRAVVGSASVTESAKLFKPKLFSFEEAEGAEEVKDWGEIGEKLR